MKSIFISFLSVLNFLLSANLIKLASIILVPNTLATEIKVESKDKLKIKRIAKEITVRIEGATQGSGVLYKKDELYSLKNPGKGFIYEVITAWHVIKDNLPGEEITIITPDNKKYYVDIQDAKQISNFDLAIIKFKSKKNYKLADYGTIESWYRGTIYVSGFPLNKKNNLNLNSGKLIAETYCGQEGYNLLYAVPTEAGMSGGAVLDQEGKLIGIHGRGEIDLASSEFRGYLRKTGVNLGLSSYLYYQSKPYFRTIKSKNDSNCEEGLEGFEYYLIAAEIEKRKDKRDKKKSIIYYDKAIKIGNEIFTHDDDKLSLVNAYIQRATTKIEVKDFNGAVQDFEKAYQIDPDNPLVQITRIYRIYLKPYDKDSAKNAINLINNVIKDLDSKPSNSKTQSNGSYYSYINEDEDLKNVYKSMFIFIRSNFKLGINDFDGCLYDLDYAYEIKNKINSDDVKYSFKDNLINLEKLHINKGNCYLGKKEYSKAINEYQNASNINPKNTIIFNKLGKIKKLKGDFIGAKEDYIKALFLDLENEETYRNLAEINKILGNNREAIENYKKSILLNPNNHLNYFSLADLYAESGELTLAEDFYSKTIKSDPTYIYALNARAKVKEKKKNFNGAIADYSKSIEINPKGFSYFERGKLYEKLGLTSKALKDYSSLIKIYRDATSYSVRGLFRFKNKNYTEAIDDYNYAIKLDPNNSDYYYFRGISKRYLRKYKEAIIDLKKAEKLGYKSPNLLVDIGYTYSLWDKNKKAIKYYNKSIELDKGNFEAYKFRGILQLNLYNFLKAKNDFEKAIIINPTKPKLHYFLGTSNFQLKDYKKSLVNFTNALNLEPNNHIYLNDLCASKYKLGDFKSALKDCNLALKINPNEGYIYDSRGKVKYALGDKRGACYDYKNAIKNGYEEREIYLESEDGRWCQNMPN